MRSKLGLRTLALMTSVMLLTLGVGTGCGDDLYIGCELDANSRDPYIQACAADGANQSCVVENYIQCDTRVCGRYEGSTPFCTIPCSDDSECANGTCKEFVLQSGRKFCVAN